MRTKLELVTLLKFLLEAKEGASEEGDSLAVRVLDVQIDTVEYVLGGVNTKTEQFIDAAEDLKIDIDALEPLYAR